VTEIRFIKYPTAGCPPSHTPQPTEGPGTQVPPPASQSSAGCGPEPTGLDDPAPRRHTGRPPGSQPPPRIA
jgi:hypothetical protein